MKKKILIIAGPAGTGKNAVINGVLNRVKKAADLITSTTRKPREGEVDGVDYFFVDDSEFKVNLENNKVFGEYYREETGVWYGILRDKLIDLVEKNDLVIGDIQIVGAKILKKNYNATTIFILPESDIIMEKRIRSRAHITDKEWQERLNHTKREMEEDLPFYDYRINNKEGELENTINEVLIIMKNEDFLFETND